MVSLSVKDIKEPFDSEREADVTFVIDAGEKKKGKEEPAREVTGRYQEASSGQEMEINVQFALERRLVYTFWKQILSIAVPRLAFNDSVYSCVFFFLTGIIISFPRCGS